MVILFNKPYGVLCQFRPSEGRLTLGDFIAHRGVHAAGRLDADSEGLLVLTDDGREQHRITDPRHKLQKTYFTEVEREPTQPALSALCLGVDLNDGMTRPAEASIVAAPAWLWPRNPPVRFRKYIPTAWIKLAIHEGRNRQVRRMTAAVGYPTLRLIRYSIGNWTLDGLAPGHSREIP